MMDEKCPKIEDNLFCTNDNRLADSCMLDTILSEQPSSCTKKLITLKTILLQRIDNNLIIVPKDNKTMMTSCEEDEQIHQLKNPILIQLQANCRIKINQNTFDFSKTQISGVPLILPEIKLHSDPEIKGYHPIEIHDPEINNLQDFTNMIRHPDPLLSVKILPHLYWHNYYCIIIAIVLAYIWYRIYGCTRLQRTIRTVIDPLTKPAQPVIEL